MRRHQPSRYDRKAFYQAMLEANNTPEFTPEHLAFLQRRSDQFYALLAK